MPAELRPKKMYSTPFGINGIFTGASLTGRPHCFGGAQRLSASMESSQTRVSELERSEREVLNAFRHQWNLHFLDGLDEKYRVKCSTPFGINGIFTG